ncbi:TPA: hypothetical protein ACF2PW_003241, partial [Legionella pneumophila]
MQQPTYSQTTKPPTGKKVIICFNSEEENEIQAFIRRFRVIHEEKGFDPDDLDIQVIYPCDIASDQYMTWSGTEPTQEQKEILSKLKPQDKIYIWGHGAPNYAYIPGAFYTEIAEYLEKGINKENFGPGKGPLNITVEICNGARGGSQGKDSFAAKLHSLLGKKGIDSTVTGRLRNVFIDLQFLPLYGIKTIERANDGLVKAGIYESESMYQRMAERSKVTYKWDERDSNVQVRVDSYRESTLIGFIKLKQSILERMNDSYTGLLNNRDLHKILLTIEFNLMQNDKNLDISLLQKSTKRLGQYCLSLGISKNELKQFGFDYFLDSLGKKATENGFLKAETGIRKDQPLLEIEKKSFYESINAHPSFMELNRLVCILKEKNTSSTTELAEIIGSSCDGYDLYSTFFLLTRNYNMVKNDGLMVVPDYIEKSINLLNRMIHLAYESKLDNLQKQKEMQEIKSQMVFYKNAKYEFENMSIL